MFQSQQQDGRLSPPGFGSGGRLTCSDGPSSVTDRLGPPPVTTRKLIHAGTTTVHAQGGVLSECHGDGNAVHGMAF